MQTRCPTREEYKLVNADKISNQGRVQVSQCGQDVQPGNQLVKVNQMSSQGRESAIVVLKGVSRLRQNLISLHQFAHNGANTWKVNELS